jgi:hypothetical protein
VPAPDSRRFRWPSAIDPGWATIGAAILAIVGTVLTVWLQRAAPAAPASDNRGGTVVVTGTSHPPGSEDGPSVPAAGSPVVSVVSRLPTDQRAVVQKVAASMLEAVKALPLVIRDSFDTNDYGWAVGDETYAQGVTCSRRLGDGVYRMTVTSTQGAAYCVAGTQKSAQNFVMSMHTLVEGGHNCDVFLQYRMSADGSDSYSLALSPQTQSVAVYATTRGQTSAVVPATYSSDVHKDGSNKVTLIVLGDTQSVYLNDQLTLLVTGETRVSTSGRVQMQVRLNEANLSETLAVDNVEMRGS